VAKDFCRRVAEQLAAASPGEYVATMSKAARKGKIFVDYLRNDRGATAVAPFSTRARPGAPVSTPLAWDELSPAIRSDHFNTGNLVARLESLRSDPWKGYFDVKQTLPKKSAKS
jgi:bifunctional non-homologous end joining protein LigD